MSINRSNYPDYGATGNPVQSRSRATATPLYHHLCDKISCNIFSINNNVAALEQASREIGSQSDTVSLREKIHYVKQNTNELSSSTAKFVKELKSLVVRGSKEQRLQSERLEKEFCATIQRYDVLQKQLAPKLKISVPIKPRSESTDDIGIDNYDERQRLIDVEKFQAQKQMQDELEFEQGLLLEREQRIRQIESDMLDVNQIFRDLAVIVHEQGSTIGTIEDNVTAAAQQVEEGTLQLHKASEYQKKYRNKICWFIIILLIVAAALAIIIVSAKS